MYKREMQSELERLAGAFPVVTVIGPRQSGKTTLVQMTFPDKPYVNLENPDSRAFAERDARAFLEQFPDGAIIDEVQRSPQLLSYIQVIVDQRKLDGMYILTGSHQLELHQAISQSLAGRTALLTLLPLSLSELGTAGIKQTLDERLLTGGFPRLFQRHLDSQTIYSAYLRTYVERDVRQIAYVKDLALFQKFIQLCAGRIGQIIKVDSLAGDVGVSSRTIKHWLSILEASYLIVLLQPYYENLGKRAIKSPKLYFTDVGLASYLLGIESTTQMARDPLRGNLVENLVLLELFKHRYNRGKDPRLYFFRDAHGHEVDFLYLTGRQFIPIEVKAAATFNGQFLKELRYFEKLVGDRFVKGYLIYSGPHEQQIKNFEVLHYMHAARAVDGV
jgi:uncharacterized protein